MPIEIVRPQRAADREAFYLAADSNQPPPVDEVAGEARTAGAIGGRRGRQRRRERVCAAATPDVHDRQSNARGKATQRT